MGLNTEHQKLHDFMVERLIAPSDSIVPWIFNNLDKGYMVWFYSQDVQGEWKYTSLEDGPLSQDWSLRVSDPALISTVEDIWEYTTLYFGTETRRDGHRYWGSYSGNSPSVRVVREYLAQREAELEEFKRWVTREYNAWDSSKVYTVEFSTDASSFEKKRQYLTKLTALGDYTFRMYFCEECKEAHPEDPVHVVLEKKHD